MENVNSKIGVMLVKKLFKEAYAVYKNEIGDAYMHEVYVSYDGHTLDVGCSLFKIKEDIDYDALMGELGKNNHLSFDKKDYKGLKNSFCLYYDKDEARHYFDLLGSEKSYMRHQAIECIIAQLAEFYADYYNDKYEDHNERYNNYQIIADVIADKWLLLDSKERSEKYYDCLDVFVTTYMDIHYPEASAYEEQNFSFVSVKKLMENAKGFEGLMREAIKKAQGK